MGMYNTINDEQIKFFSVPILGFPDHFSHSNNFIFYSGGELRYFDEGDAVPCQMLWENFGNNFNIMDLFPYEHDFPMIHLIRDGKNAGFVYLDDVTEDIFKYPSYTDRNIPLVLNSVDDLRKYYEARVEYTEMLKNRKKDADREWFDFIGERKKYSKEEYEKKLKELTLKLDKENADNEEYLKPFRLKVSAFHKEESENIYKYETFGAYVQVLFDKGKSMLEADPEATYTVEDERLLYVCAYNDMMDIINSEKDFILHYHEALKIDGIRQAQVKRKLDFIMEAYDIIKDWTFTKDKFFEQYALRDILNGRHKEYYLKYNIIPYEGFDYSIWDEVEDEQKS